MNLHDATEAAYKKGYADGKREAVKHGVSDRENLIDLIDDFIDTIDLRKWYSEEEDEHLADYLIAHGVTFWLKQPYEEGADG